MVFIGSVQQHTESITQDSFLLRIQGKRKGMCVSSWPPMTFTHVTTEMQSYGSNRDDVLFLRIHISVVLYFKTCNRVYKLLSWSPLFLPSCFSLNTDEKSLFEIKAQDLFLIKLDGLLEWLYLVRDSLSPKKCFLHLV